MITKHTMGDLSDLRFVPACVAKTPIDWTRVPEATKELLLNRWGYYPDRPLPTTVRDLAREFDEYKFFGYFDTDLCMLLMDISEYGLQATHKQAGPRFYMKYLRRLWFLLFTPGTRDCIMGYSHYMEEDGEDEEISLAENFDVIFELGILGPGEMVRKVHATKRLWGWNASIVTLNGVDPSSHLFK